MMLINQRYMELTPKNEQEKLFEWTDTARVWGLFSQTYYQRFCFARNKHISHAVYEKLV
ncbi:hypothetical protein [uncultured Legionella sp.]|uniref:hypothetical protein n=1 Tax=uncultured Legionella sp. TaxID=210934 RepID=UPI0026105B42|nr:hypothetical protein [uncultured Legionella sp.]